MYELLRLVQVNYSQQSAAIRTRSGSEMPCPTLDLGFEHKPAVSAAEEAHRPQAPR